MTSTKRIGSEASVQQNVGVRRTIVNVSTSLLSYGLSFVIAIAYTPFLIRELGVVAYGVIALTFALVQFAGPISQTISATVNQKLLSTWRDPNAYNRTFSTALTLCLTSTFMLFLVGFAMVPFFDNLIDVPKSLLIDAKWVFVATGAAFLIAFASTPLSGVIFSSNAIYVLNLKNAIESLFRVLAVVFFFIFFSVSLKYVALSILISSLFGFAVLFVSAIIIRRELRYWPNVFSFKLAAEMSKTGAGVILVQLGTLLLTNSDLIMINIIYGPEASGAYAAAAQWALVLRGLVSSVGVAITAHVMIDYFNLDGPERLSGLSRSIRFLAAFASLPAGYVAGVSPYLLNVWVGPELENHGWTLALLAFPVAISATGVPILASVLAADRIGKIGVGYLMMGLAFPFSAVIASKLDWGGAEVALVLGAFLIGKNYLIIIPFASKTLGGSSAFSLVIASLHPIGWTTLSFGITAIMAKSFEPKNYLTLILIGVLVFAIYTVFVYITLPRCDRQMIVSAIRRKLTTGMILD